MTADRVTVTGRPAGAAAAIDWQVRLDGQLVDTSGHAAARRDAYVTRDRAAAEAMAARLRRRVVDPEGRSYLVQAGASDLARRAARDLAVALGHTSAVSASILYVDRVGDGLYEGGHRRGAAVVTVALDDLLDHAPVPVMRPHCGVCSRQLADDGSHEPSGYTDTRRLYAAQAQAAREARAAAARPYVGAIAQCQVGVMTSDRAATYYRCSKPPRWLRDDDGLLMAVCSVHRASRHVFRFRGTDRWHGDWPPADEPVEPQP